MAEDAQHPGYLVEKEDVIEQRTISFFGDEIIAALTNTKSCGRLRGWERNFS